MFIEKLNAAKYDPNADMELPYNSHQASYNAGLDKACEIYEAANSPEQPDDCRKEFEQRFAGKHTQEEFATFKDGFYNRGHINADWIAFKNGWDSRLSKRDDSPYRFCIKAGTYVGKEEYRCRGANENTPPLESQPPDERMISRITREIMRELRRQLPPESEVNCSAIAHRVYAGLVSGGHIKRESVIYMNWEPHFFVEIKDGELVQYSNAMAYEINRIEGERE